MKTVATLFAVAMLVVIATWAYRVNYDTQDAERRVEQLRRAIAEERAAIAMLRAEWAYLNRPDRLRELAELHFGELGLMPLDAEHFADAAKLPFPNAHPPIFTPTEGEFLLTAEGFR